MGQRTGAIASSVGLRAKTARAIAVVLTGSRDEPRALSRAEIPLASRSYAATFQPYHDVMDLPWEEATVAVRRAASAIAGVAIDEVEKLLRAAEAKGGKVRALGVVGAPARKLEAIGNPHIRAHAAEGVLFRQVLEDAGRHHRLATRAFLEKGLEAAAASELGLSCEAVAETLAAFGKALGRPWRADEKAAALAAWLVLR